MQSKIARNIKHLTALMLCLLATAVAGAQNRLPVRPHHNPEAVIDSIAAARPDSVVVSLGEVIAPDFMPDSVDIAALEVPQESPYDRWEERQDAYNPDPTRAVWMAALFPGLGQLYNRRYWKLPIVIGAYMGLGYATTWNNSMLSDYTKAYRDIMDNDPNTNSYMNLFPPTTQESSIDKSWLTKVLQSRKNTFRRNRDLCIIAMVGVYLIAVVDAYVDASLTHFDISPDLSMDLAPSLFPQQQGMKPGVGLTWALNF